jgi:hypothetical protein
MQNIDYIMDKHQRAADRDTRRYKNIFILCWKLLSRSENFRVRNLPLIFRSIFKQNLHRRTTLLDHIGLPNFWPG